MDTEVRERYFRDPVVSPLSTMVMPVYHRADRAKVIKVVVQLPSSYPVRVLFRAIGTTHVPSHVLRNQRLLVVHRHQILKVRWDVYGLSEDVRESIPNCPCRDLCNTPTLTNDSEVNQVYAEITVPETDEFVIYIDPKQEMDLLIRRREDNHVDPDVKVVTLRPTEIAKLIYIAGRYPNIKYVP